LSPEPQAHTDFISKSLVTGDKNEDLMVGIDKHLLQDNNITLVIQHALQVTGSPETVNSKAYYHHSDHRVGR
jgi:hypothetical protein